MDIQSFIYTLISLFIMLGVGYVSGKKRIIDEVSSKKLSTLILKICQPCLIIYSLVRMKYSADNLKLGALTFALGICVHLFVAVIAYFVCRRLKPLNERKLIEFSMIFGNSGFIGIPIFESLFGESGAFMGAFIISGFNILMWTLGTVVFARERDDIKLTARKAFINRGTVPSVIGFAIFLLPMLSPSLTLPTFILTPLKYIAEICTPLSMFIIGALISRMAPKRIFATPKIYLLCVMKLIVNPLVITVLMKLVGFDNMWTLFATALAAMPSATSVSMFAELYEIDPEFSSVGVGATSLFCMATMPCIMIFAEWFVTLW